MTLANTPILERILAVEGDRIALESRGEKLTYAQMIRRAGTMAARLREEGVTRGSHVVVCAERGIDQIVSLLGAMMAGAAFVPVDPSLPEERMLQILSDLKPAALVSDLIPSRLERVQVPTIHPWASRDEGKTLLEVASGDELAYVIYTSGSTGSPKGCMLSHNNLCHLVNWHLAEFQVSSSDRASHMAGLGFDASVWEVWPYLAAGATVVVMEESVRSDAMRVRDWFATQRISIGFVPTPLAELLISLEWPENTALRAMLTGGDTLHFAPAKPLPFRFYNNYGPTECTVVATSIEVQPGREGLPTIGPAIAGATAYVLDGNGRPVAVGEEGELYIGGDGVGLGYHNLPDQNAQRFMPDPFRGAGRMYRTGDQVQLLANGDMAFLGRKDQQVKIRGFRIELEEIVHVLNRHSAVCFSVVVPDSPANDQLIGYVMLREGSTVTMRELQKFVAAYLPEYMVPARFGILTELPLTHNCKVDRALLPAIMEDNSIPEGAPEEEVSEIASMVLGLVRDALHNPSVQVDDDFFMLGGHSLMATQLSLRIHEAFGIEIGLADMFEAGTAAEIARRIEALILDQIMGLPDEDAERLLGWN